VKVEFSDLCALESLLGLPWQIVRERLQTLSFQRQVRLQVKHKNLTLVGRADFFTQKSVPL
jgi:hypothetical protein